MHTAHHCLLENVLIAFCPNSVIKEGVGDTRRGEGYRPGIDAILSPLGVYGDWW